MKAKNLYEQLSEATRLGVACLLNNTVQPAFNNMLRDIPAQPHLEEDFKIGDVVPVVLMYQLQQHLNVVRKDADEKKKPSRTKS